MVKIHMIIAILVLCIWAISILAEVEAIDKSPEAVEKWFKQLPHKKERLTKLRFYLHETNGGIYGTTIYPVAQPNISLTSPITSFGKVSMFDDPLKVGRDPKSRIVGTAQGSTGSSSLSDSSLLMTLHFTFTAGRYNDSTLTVIGRDSLMNKYREFAVVGGSGAFRMARGIATAETAEMDPATRDLIIEYNVIVIHYSTPSATIRRKTNPWSPSPSPEYPSFDTNSWSPSPSPEYPSFNTYPWSPSPSPNIYSISDRIPWSPSASPETVSTANKFPPSQEYIRLKKYEGSS